MTPLNHDLHLNKYSNIKLSLKWGMEEVVWKMLTSYWRPLCSAANSMWLHSWGLLSVFKTALFVELISDILQLMSECASALCRQWGNAEPCWEEEGEGQGRVQSNPPVENFSFFHSLKRTQEDCLIFLNSKLVLRAGWAEDPSFSIPSSIKACIFYNYYFGMNCSFPSHLPSPDQRQYPATAQVRQ